MSVLLSTFAQLLQVVLLVYATKELSRVVDIGLKTRKYWIEERRVRLCGSLKALERNIDDGAKALEERSAPEKEALAIHSAASLLKEKTARYYQALGENCAPLGQRFHLVLQIHPGQPATWPNWVVRYLRP